MFNRLKQKVNAWKERNLFSLVNIKNTLRGSFGKLYYSQSGEDIVARKLLPKTKKGFYVDVGAYHPRHYSNTHLLHMDGWSGINIDPNPLSIRQFEKERPRDINIQNGVSSKKDTLTYYVYNHQTYNTFSKEQAEKNQEKKHLTLLRKEAVSTLPLADILDTHLPKDTSIELLSVDAEGMDLEVLQSNNWKRYSPQVIIVENSTTSIEGISKNEIYAYLHEKGYELMAFTGLSMLFKKTT